MSDQPLPPGSAVLIYTRVSPRPDDEDGELSIESQLAELQALATRNSWTVAGVYTDQLISGATDARPAFQALIARALGEVAERSPVQGILVWRFSRFARDDVDSMLYKARLAKAGVKVVSYKEPIPEAGGWGVLIERIIEVTNARALDQIREDALRGMRHLASQGYITGGRIPVGYLSVPVQRGTRPDGSPRLNSTLIPDPARAADVRGAFEMLVAGASYREINEGYGLRATPRGLAYLFRNPVYIGQRVFGRCQDRQPQPEDQWLVVEDAHPAIVPRALWDRAQALLRARQHPAERGRLRGCYLLSGLAVCGWCGGPLNGTTNRGHGRVYAYYRCSNRHYHQTCALPYIRADAVERGVVTTITTQILVPARIQGLVDQLNARLAMPSGDGQGRRDALANQVRALEQRIAHLVGPSRSTGSRPPTRRRGRWPSRRRR